jgi:hypothetical protein
MVVELSRVEFGVSVALIKVRRSARVPVGTCANTVPSLMVRAAQRRNSATHQNKTTIATRDNYTNMSSIEAAIAAIESLEPGEQFSYRQIAKQYCCSRIALAKRYQGLSTSRATQAIPPQQEQELLLYIKQLTRQGLPPTRAMIQNFASQIAQRELGVHWVDRFVKRYPDELVSKWTTAMDNSCHKADSGSKYSLYFNLLREKIEQYHVEPRHTYNMDEKGFMLGVVGRSKKIFSRTLYKERKRRSTIQNGPREWITLLACICADGSYLEPALIYQLTSGAIQDSWLQALDRKTHQIQISSSSSGWTNNDIGLAWLKQVFDRGTKAKAQLSYRLLILDGHGSHLTMDFIEYCDQNKILLAVYPPHSTQTLQSLDTNATVTRRCYVQASCYRVLRQGHSLFEEELGPYVNE